MPSLYGTFADGSSFHMLVSGPAQFIQVGRKLVWFEETHWGEPVPLSKAGDPLVAVPSRAFYEAVRVWVKQGRRLDGGRCVWDAEPPPPPKRLRHLGGRHYLVLPDDPTPEDA